MTTLLEKARAVQVKPNETVEYSDEHLEVVLAYLNGEITNKQMSAVSDKGPTAASSFVGQVLAWAVRNNKLKKV